MYNTRRVMEECLAIKPDLIFLWDEAWSGLRALVAVPAAAHGDGGCRGDQGVDARYQALGRGLREAAEALGDKPPSDEVLLRPA